MHRELKSLWSKVARHLPGPAAQWCETTAVNPIRLTERLVVGKAVRSGPPYRPSHRRIIIDITSSCDLACRDCNRSCGDGQAPANEHMSVAQIRRFLSESIQQRRSWEEIGLEGGEPTLHPQLTEIITLLLDYRRRFSPRTNIQLSTNGYREESRSLLDLLRRRGVLLVNTRKRSALQQHHWPFNIAPCDLAELAGADFGEGCYLPACYGLGLTRHGYYPHPICGGIDRVFGFDIGRKHLPYTSDGMEGQFASLCRLCGFFGHTYFLRTKTKGYSVVCDGGRVSRTWDLAYERFREERPKLTPYPDERAEQMARGA